MRTAVQPRWNIVDQVRVRVQSSRGSLSPDDAEQNEASCSHLSSRTQHGGSHATFAAGFRCRIGENQYFGRDGFQHSVAARRQIQRQKRLAETVDSYGVSSNQRRYFEFDFAIVGDDHALTHSTVLIL